MYLASTVAFKDDYLECINQFLDSRFYCVLEKGCLVFYNGDNEKKSFLSNHGSFDALKNIEPEYIVDFTNYLYVLEKYEWANIRIRIPFSIVDDHWWRGEI